jgi:hypothetical protein
MSVFFDKERIKRFTLLRAVYAFGFVFFFLSTEIGRKVYRPWVYSNGIDDFGIADTIGNSLGTLTQIFLLLAIYHSNRAQSYIIVAFITVGYILYEIAQPWLPRGTFDLGDIYATIGAGVAALILTSAIHAFKLDRKLYADINKSAP